ncbi:MAG: response regulator [Dehalococcoidales bacterium]|nr:MAG: response regulator [Dehalococcoidales bacterium]
MSEGGEKMKPILIVEDEAIMRESLKDWLKDGGYQVETAEEGSEALKTIEEHDFGVVVLDLRLPGKDGLEVLREAKERRPQLKGIIITAYPSVETAVEAMKIGAVDYMPKPFDLNEMEKLIRETLGPVQIEITPRAGTKEIIDEPVKVEEVKVEEVVVEEVRVEEVIAVIPEEVPGHLRQGKTLFEAGRYIEALRVFQAILEVAPANIENRVWIQKIKRTLAEPETEALAPGEEKPKQCVWMSMGMVSYRVCTNNYDCMTCEFDQEMQDKLASGDSSELDAAMEKLLALPGSQRLCRYALKNDVSYRLCSRIYQCETCEFGQMMDDALQQKLAKRAVELAARQEASHKKELSWWWSYWGEN